MMYNYKEKICKFCKEKYKPKGGSQKYCKICGIIYTKHYRKKYRIKNKSEIKIKDKIRYKKNKEKWLEYDKEYRNKNKEKIKRRKKKYYKQNREKKLKESKEWYENNKEKKLIASKKYLKTKNGKIKRNLSIQNRNIKKYHLIHLFNKEEWTKKLNNYNMICYVCKQKEQLYNNLTLDHIYPISRAYNDYINELKNENYIAFPKIYTIDDIEPMCSSCNSRKGDEV